MKITNNFGMPQPFVDFAINDKYSKGKADISVTTLIDSPKIRLMKEISKTVGRPLILKNNKVPEKIVNE